MICQANGARWQHGRQQKPSAEEQNSSAASDNSGVSRAPRNVEFSSQKTVKRKFEHLNCQTLFKKKKKKEPLLLAAAWNM